MSFAAIEIRYPVEKKLMWRMEHGPNLIYAKMWQCELTVYGNSTPPLAESFDINLELLWSSRAVDKMIILLMLGEGIAQK